MSRKAEIQILVQRLLRGICLQADLQRIFLYLRNDPHCRASVKEIGDFIGHSETKKKGVVTRELESLFTFLNWRVPDVHPVQKALEMTDLPPFFKRLVNSNAERISEETFQKHLGIGKIEGLKKLNDILACAKKIGEKTVFTTCPSPEDMSFVGFCMVPLFRAPCFTATQLIQELEQTLLRQNIIERDEVPSLWAVKDQIARFCLYALHLTEIEIPGSSKIEVNVTICDGLVSASASLLVEDGTKSPFEYTGVVFDSEIMEEHVFSSRPVFEEFDSRHLFFPGTTISIGDLLEYDADTKLNVLRR